MNYYAHSLGGRPEEEWQGLREHLVNVAENAKKFAAEFGAGDWAYLAGLWHDLGKYLSAWQKYLLNQTENNEDNLKKGGLRPNHSTAGAVLALERLKNQPPAKILAYLIAGHHAGLPDWSPDSAGGDLINRLYKNPLDGDLAKNELDQVERISEAQKISESSLPGSAPMGIKTQEEMLYWGEFFHLWVRMLFSCLVDSLKAKKSIVVSSLPVRERGLKPAPAFI